MSKKTLILKILSFAVLSAFLSSCVTGPDGHLKRSANNKLFDRKGFKGGKRTPLYNKKYIARAKKNILKNELDDDYYDDYDDEMENPSRDNIELYKAMLEDDLERQGKKRNRRSRNRGHDRAYPSLIKANNRIDSNSDSMNLELREELEQIKSMLKDAKTDLSSYKCPNATTIEKKNNNDKNDYRPRSHPDRKLLKESPVPKRKPHTHPHESRTHTHPHDGVKSI